MFDQFTEVQCDQKWFKAKLWSLEQPFTTFDWLMLTLFVYY